MLKIAFYLTYLLILYAPDQIFAASTSQPFNSLTAASIYLILGIKPESNDMLPPLTTALTALKKSPTKTSEALDPLVDVIMRGVKDDSLINGTAEEQTVADGTPVQAQRLYGTERERSALTRLLYDKGKADKSEKYLKAALLFSFLDAYPVPPGDVIARIIDRDKQFGELAHLTDEQIKGVIALADIATNLNNQRFQTALPSWQAIDQLLLKGFSLNQCRAALTSLDQWWKTPCPLIEERWQFSHAAWMLMNHARKANDTTAIQEISDHITAWQKQTDDPRVQRWLRQAATIIGQPTRMHATVHMNADGTVKGID